MRTGQPTVSTVGEGPMPIHGETVSTVSAYGTLTPEKPMAKDAGNGHCSNFTDVESNVSVIVRWLIPTLWRRIMELLRHGLGINKFIHRRILR